MKVSVTRVTKAFTVYPGMQKMQNCHGNFRNQKAKTAGDKHYDYNKGQEELEFDACWGNLFHIV